ncbi:MAG: hypothetical protein V4747_17400 [Pseudomonadota bacterium]|jgi:hypothetical protein
MSDTIPDAQILLLAINESYWLCEGVDYIDHILWRGGFPVPVRCLRFRDKFEMTRYLGPERNVGTMWAINPDIIARLRRDDHLSEIGYEPE